MKRFATAMMALVCAAAGGAYWLDLVNYTDLSTGFVSYGNYWIRYGVIGGVLLLNLLACLMAPRWSESIGKHAPVRGTLCLIAGIGFAVLCGLRAFSWQTYMSMDKTLTVLYLLSAIWMFMLGRSRLSSVKQTPSRSTVLGIAGTLSLCLLTIQRFCVNPAGVVRVGYILSALAALAAMLFCTAQIRASYQLGKKGGRWLFFTGMSAFLMCSCMAFPGAVCGYMVELVTIPALAEAAVLFLVGLTGLATAFAAVGPAQEEDEKEEETPPEENPEEQPETAE